MPTDPALTWIIEIVASLVFIIACVVFAHYFMNERGQALFKYLPGIVAGTIIGIRHWK
jgi:uncharacterized membrane protein